MKANKVICTILCVLSVFFFSCEPDPTFQPETESVEISTYTGGIGYTTASVYCQISSNVGILYAELEISFYKDMKRADCIRMEKTSDYPKEADFNKTDVVYYTDLSQLEDNTTYYGRITVYTQLGGYYEKEGIIIKTKSLTNTAVTTKAATDISYTYATLNGEVLSATDVSISETGFYYSLKSDMTNAATVKGNKYYGAFSKEISNLEPNKVYYFTAYAIVNGEMYQGKVLSFTTSAYTLADIETGNVSNITYTTANCTIVINNSGNSSITKKGILYGTNYNLTEQNAENLEVYSSNVGILKNLKAGEYYYYRAYAINTAGISYGYTEGFWTKDLGEISIETGEATNVGSNRARMYYSIKSEGYQIIKYGLIYGDYWNFNAYSLEGNSTYNVSSVSYGTDYSRTGYGYVNTLSKNTYYAFQAYVRYIDKWGDEQVMFGDIETFYTLE